MMTDEKNDTARDRAALVSIMTTEHYNLQGARSGTISDANGRASLFLSTVSGTLVALSFVGQISNVGEPFVVFALVLFPSLYFIGLVTSVRVMETSIEDAIYARGINRIRHYYLEVAPEMHDYFILSSHDDMRGMMRNMGLAPSRTQVFLTTAGLVAVINSVIAGAFFGVLVRAVVNLPMPVAVGAGVAGFALSVFVLLGYQMTRWVAVEKTLAVRFPTGDGQEEPR